MSEATVHPETSAACSLDAPYIARDSACMISGAQSHPDPVARLEWHGERPDRPSERSPRSSRGIHGTSESVEATARGARGFPGPAADLPTFAAAREDQRGIGGCFLRDRAEPKPCRPSG